MMRRGFTPNESLQFGFLEPGFDKDNLSKYVSRREMSSIQKNFNPPTMELLTEDKSIFYKYCAAAGIPVPKLYAVFYRRTAGHSTDGAILSAREDWVNFIYQLPADFIVKPARAKYGYCINCFLKTREEGYIDAASQTRFRAEDIYDLMLSNPYHDTFVIQERIKNHPELARLSNTEFLQTLRCVTVVDKIGQGRILCSYFKLIVGQHVNDNHDHGRTGNLLAEIDLNSGTLEKAVKLIPDRPGFETVTTHPVTGISLKGFKMPLWEDVCKLVKDTSLKVLPLRTIGWDVAITPNGPLIIEGNSGYDPPTPFQKKMDVFLSRLYAGN
jgi:hypothetical protein